MHSLLQAIAILSLGKLLFAIQDVIIKQMSTSYPVAEIVFIRGLVAVPILLLLILLTLRLRELLRHHPGYHVLRGSLMFGAFMLFYIALAEISLTTTTALFFTAPFFITLLARPMLGERFGPRRMLGLCAGFIGVLIVLRPGSADFSLILLLPIVSALLYALCQTLVRYAKLTAPPSVMSLYAALAFVVLGPVMGLALPLLLPAASADAGGATLFLPWRLPEGSDLWWLMTTGLTSALGFMCTSHAFQREQASRIAPFEYVMIIWVTLLSFVVWGEVPDGQTLLGITLIVLSGIYVLRREGQRQSQLPATNGINRSRR